MLNNSKILNKLIISKDEHTIKLFSPAKVNIALSIIGRLKTGYHLIQSVFCPVSLYDTLTIRIVPNSAELKCNVVLGEKLKRHVANLSAEKAASYASISNKNNIAQTAVESILQHLGVIKKFGFEIEILKNIPLGAGLGGGSSNAAMAVYGLLELLSIDTDINNFAGVLSRIGADIPFFLNPRISFVSGIGENVIPLRGEGLEFFKNLKAIIVKPLDAVNTKDAYTNLGFPKSISSYDENEHGLLSSKGMSLCSEFILEPEISDNSNNLLTLLEQKGICDMPFSATSSKIVGNIHNDFQNSVLESHERINECYLFLNTVGAEKVVLTGSGSALVCFFLNKEAQTNAKKLIDEKQEFFAEEVSLLV